MPIFTCGKLINSHHRKIKDAIKKPCQITRSTKCLFNEPLNKFCKFIKTIVILQLNPKNNSPLEK